MKEVSIDFHDEHHYGDYDAKDFWFLWRYDGQAKGIIWRYLDGLLTR